MRVVVVDDHALVRSSLLRILHDEPDLVPVGSAGSLAEAADVVEAARPDVILLDQVLPDGIGTAAITGLLERHPPAAVVMLTGRPSDALLRAAVAGGAAGMVSKSDGFDAVLGAVRAAAGGDVALEPGLLQRLLARPGRRPGPAPEVLAEDRGLLVLLSAGMQIAEIAERRAEPADAVRRRVLALRIDLGARSTLEALVLAGRRGWLGEQG